MFTDSIEGNLALIESLIEDVPMSRRREVAQAASHMESAFTRLQKEHPKNNAIALGSALAIYKIAQRLVENTNEKPGSGLILPG